MCFFWKSEVEKFRGQRPETTPCLTCQRGSTMSRPHKLGTPEFQVFTSLAMVLKLCASLLGCCWGLTPTKASVLRVWIHLGHSLKDCPVPRCFLPNPFFDGAYPQNVRSYAGFKGPPPKQSHFLSLWTFYFSWQTVLKANQKFGGFLLAHLLK